MTPKDKLEELRKRWLVEEDNREAIEKEAKEYQCSQMYEVNGELVKCKNPIRYEGSYVCTDHIWKHGEVGENRSKLTIKEIQEKLLSFKTAEQTEIDY